jgi:predicted house-cleaning noncanonical NTP pyrophosphatase (MazG superfamily)
MRISDRVTFRKLVRDKIPELIEKAGKKPSFERLTKKDRWDALNSKLNEEIDELQTAQEPESVLEEIADIHEVLMAMVYEIGYIDADLFLKAKQKKREKGAFDEFIWLESVE